MLFGLITENATVGKILSASIYGSLSHPIVLLLRRHSSTWVATPVSLVPAPKILTAAGNRPSI
jgi:hypothetical protein